MENTAPSPANAPISWSGTFPQNYEDNLKFIFGPYAADLVSRVDAGGLTEVLELACGTGQVTQLLAERLDEGASLTATDLSSDMMDVAKNKVKTENVSWEKADMCAIPYDSEKFGLVICQFGIMFANDKAAAVKEMYRVLKKGGKLLFNTWGALGSNHVFETFNNVMIKHLDLNIAAAEQGPFSMQDEKATLKLLEDAGFKNIVINPVSKNGESPDAAQAAKGFFQGSMLAANLREKNPALAVNIQSAIAEEFKKRLGDKPMVSPLMAWIFEAQK